MRFGKIEKLLALAFALSLALVLTVTLTHSRSLSPSNQVVWNVPELWNKGLPSSIKVYQTNSSYTSGVPMTASYCKFSLNDPTVQLKVVHSEVNLKTPLQYAAEEPSEVYMAVNAGYFNMLTNVSMSLVVEDGEVLYPNQPNVTVTSKNGSNATYYPTLSAFGIHSNKSAEITWVYSIDNNPSDVYSYPTPSPICLNCAPEPVPNVTFPAPGEPWEVAQAVGGGPVLAKDGQIMITTEQEMVDNMFAAHISPVRNPRTAICVTEDEEIIVMAVDGRYPLSDGLLLEELAGLMMSLGCKDVLTLDGGGSTALIVNGYLTNRPADPTGMRPVTSALLLVKKKQETEIVSV